MIARGPRRDDRALPPQRPRAPRGAADGQRPVAPRIIAMDGVNSMTGNAPDLARVRSRRPRVRRAAVRRRRARLRRDRRAVPGRALRLGAAGQLRRPPPGRRPTTTSSSSPGSSKAYSRCSPSSRCPTRLKDVLKVAAPPYLYSGPSPVASLATTLAGLEVNAERGDRIRYEMHRKTDAGARTACTSSTSTPRTTSGLPAHRDPARQPRGHRRGRPLPVRPRAST